jgi:3-dehydroquinate synthase
MTIVRVTTPGGDYPIHIENGRLERLSEAIPADATAVALVSNPTVLAQYGERVRSALQRSGKLVTEIVLPDGESYKTWESLNKIFDGLLQSGLDRKAVLVAFGGGVVGDMGGFAAACYMRGIRYVQVPTTLLSQVDSSVGGKTAINHPLGKNMIGAFYQPISVQIDPLVLGSLPAREISAGLAEVIKYGLIIDSEFFSWCEANAEALRALEPEAITHAIKRSCELKARVVSQDERESGMRAILNLGHTFGHAIEAGLGFGEWLHGEAVGCGMVQAAELSADLLGFPRSDVERVRSLVERIGCPTIAPDLGTDRWIELMGHDKKAEGGTLKFVLMSRIGEADTLRVEPSALEPVLERTTRDTNRS